MQDKLMKKSSKKNNTKFVKFAMTEVENHISFQAAQRVLRFLFYNRSINFFVLK